MIGYDELDTTDPLGCLEAAFTTAETRLGAYPSTTLVLPKYYPSTTLVLPEYYPSTTLVLP